MAAATSSDPILMPLPNISAEQSSRNAPTIALLRSAFSDGSTVQQIYTQKLEHRPLALNPTTLSQQESRRLKRLEKVHKKRNPRSLSSKDKRRLRIYDLPKSEIKYYPYAVSSGSRSNRRYDNFLRLNLLWNRYIAEIVPSDYSAVSALSHGPILLKADYHGSHLVVENCRCKERIGIQGICVKETKNMFEIVTKEDKLAKVPKENSLFRAVTQGGLEWRLWGNQFLTRSGERSGKRFTGKVTRGKLLLEL
jgi:ribonuclease P protein subunit POP4